MDRLKDISKKLTEEFTSQLSKSGMMFRIFSRVKTLSSMKHKMEVKYAGRKSASKLQDVIGIRIVVYFQDDVDALSLYFSQMNVVKESIDEFDTSTFRPQRLNLTCRLPENMIPEFRAALPSEYADWIDDTYEIQIRTVFSEGWHEVEHDLRYKCKADWEGCESQSRILNGLIATLETAEWNMKALFNDVAVRNLDQRNYSAMLRNKMHIRLKGEGLSQEIKEFLLNNHNIAKAVMSVDRLIIMHTLLAHSAKIELDYDRLFYLINRIEIMDSQIHAMEPRDIAQDLNMFLLS